MAATSATGMRRVRNGYAITISRGASRTLHQPPSQAAPSASAISHARISTPPKIAIEPTITRGATAAGKTRAYQWRWNVAPDTRATGLNAGLASSSSPRHAAGARTASSPASSLKPSS